MVRRNTEKPFGGIAKYDSEREDWSSYLERIDLFFTANDVTGEAKKKSMLLNCCEIAA